MRCAYCHEQLSGVPEFACGDCGTGLHEDCAGTLGRCPTLGCSGSGFAELAAPFEGFSTRRRGLWIAGALAPLLACVFEALGANVQEGIHFHAFFALGHEPLRFGVALAPAVVLALALPGLIGIGLVLRRHFAAAKPVLALAIVVALVQSLLSVALGPHVVLLPFLALSTCADAWQQAKRYRPRRPTAAARPGEQAPSAIGRDRKTPVRGD